MHTMFSALKVTLENVLQAMPASSSRGHCPGLEIYSLVMLEGGDGEQQGSFSDMKRP